MHTTATGNKFIRFLQHIMNEWVRAGFEPATWEKLVAGNITKHDVTLLLYQLSYLTHILYIVRYARKFKGKNRNFIESCTAQSPRGFRELCTFGVQTLCFNLVQLCEVYAEA